MLKNYYVSTTQDINRHGLLTLTINRITTEKFKGRDFKVTVDIKDPRKKQGHLGVWQTVVNQLAFMHWHHERPVLVITSRKLGWRTCRNQTYLDNQNENGFIHNFELKDAESDIVVDPNATMAQYSYQVGDSDIWLLKHSYVYDGYFRLYFVHGRIQAMDSQKLWESWQNLNAESDPIAVSYCEKSLFSDSWEEIEIKESDYLGMGFYWRHGRIAARYARQNWQRFIARHDTLAAYLSEMIISDTCEYDLYSRIADILQNTDSNSDKISADIACFLTHKSDCQLPDDGWSTPLYSYVAQPGICNEIWLERNFGRFALLLLKRDIPR